MVRHIRFRQSRRYQCRQDIDYSVYQSFLRGVWRLEWDCHSNNPSIPPNPYYNHWARCILEASDRDLLQLQRSEVAVKLVELLKDRLDDDVSSIIADIQADYTASIAPKTTLTDKQAHIALQYATKLWLHVEPAFDTSSPSTTSFRSIVRACLPEKSASNTIRGRLTNDFCAKHLDRKGGIRVVWTNQLDKHLGLHKEGEGIYVFKHSSMLLAMKSHAQGNPYPADFIEETLSTLYLLFRPLNDRKEDWNLRKYKERDLDVDLELAMAGVAVFDLQSYPYWHRRLAAIQEAYSSKTPSGLVQWWFDRRNRVQWATFWVAFIVLVLTIVFGVIQCVTGILQVYIAIHPLS